MTRSGPQRIDWVCEGERTGVNNTHAIIPHEVAVEDMVDELKEEFVEKEQCSTPDF